MKTYNLVWMEYHIARVEAESESAARQAWIDGAVDANISTHKLLVVNEMPGDET